MIINLLALIVVLGVLVFLHEGGHFLAARAVGAKVSVFSLGFGRRLFGFRRRETDYRVSLIPLGGYVRIEGLGPDESDVAGAEASSEELLSRWRRAVILISGPLANVVGAIGFIALAFMVGVPVPAWQDDPPVVGWVDPASPAATAGILAGDLVLELDGQRLETWRELQLATLSRPERATEMRIRREGQELVVEMTPEADARYGLGHAGLAPPLPADVPRVAAGSAAAAAGITAGDRIVAIDGEPVTHFFDLVRLVSSRPGQPTTVTVLRDGEPLDLTATPRSEAGVGRLGIPAPNPTVMKRLGPFRAVREAAVECRLMTRETLRVLRRMVTGQASMRQMSGPIEIARFSGEAARTGIDAFIWLMGIISLQLAIFNLLPVPVLDGGHLAILGVETAMRRDLSFRTKERILTVGFWLIIALIAVVLFNDVLKNLPPSVLRFIPGVGQ